MAVIVVLTADAVLTMAEPYLSRKGVDTLSPT